MEHLSIRLTNVTYMWYYVQTWQLSDIFFSVSATATHITIYRHKQHYPIIHLSFSFLNSLKASIGDLHPTFSCKDFVNSLEQRNENVSCLVHLFLCYLLLPICILLQTWMWGRSTLINGLVSISSSMVEGVVGWPAWFWILAHVNFCCILKLSGSIDIANCKFFTAYYKHNQFKPY